MSRTLGRLQEMVQVTPRLSKTALYALQDMNTELEVQITSELVVLIREVRTLLTQYEQMQAKSVSKSRFNVGILLNLLPKGFALYERSRRYFSSERFEHFRVLIRTIAVNAKEVMDAEWEQAHQQANRTTHSLFATSPNVTTNETVSSLLSNVVWNV